MAGDEAGAPTLAEPEVFVLADHALLSVVGRIADDQWDQPVSADFPVRQIDGRRPTLREVIAYHAYDDAWVPDMLAGRTMEEAGRTRFDGDLLGDNPKAAFAALVEGACAAARAVADLERTVHCSFGDYTVREYFWQINGFRGLRAHDIAKLIGVDTRLPADLVQGLWDEISPHADEWRAIGVFQAAVPVPEGAALQDRLLGLTGRQPDGR